MRLLYILTASESGGFLKGQLQFLRSQGWHIELCAPEETTLVREIAAECGGRLYTCPMAREISPASDLVSFIALARLLHRVRPDVIFTIGPKAGLIGGLAGATCGISTRIQSKWGLRLETERGGKRLLLTAAEIVSSILADRTFFDGASTLNKAVELGLVRRDKARLIGSGSANGIDSERFVRSPGNLAAAASFKSRLGLNPKARLLGFVGRICQDKGLEELTRLWRQLSERHPELHLAVIGANECRSKKEMGWLKQLQSLRNVHFTGPLGGMEGIFPAIDVLVAPSHREGFGVAVLEAAAAEVPTAAFDVTGIRDAVVDGRTGLLAPFAEVRSLQANIERYLADETMRKEHGAAGRQRVLAEFRRERVWGCYHQALLEAADEIR